MVLSFSLFSRVNSAGVVWQWRKWGHCQRRHIIWPQKAEACPLCLFSCMHAVEWCRVYAAWHGNCMQSLVLKDFERSTEFESCSARRSTGPSSQGSPSATTILRDRRASEFSATAEWSAPQLSFFGRSDYQITFYHMMWLKDLQLLLCRTLNFASTSCWLRTRHCLDAEAEPVWKTAVWKASWSDLCFSSYRLSSLQRSRPWSSTLWAHLRTQLSSFPASDVSAAQAKQHGHGPMVVFYWPILWIDQLNGVIFFDSCCQRCMFQTMRKECQGDLRHLSLEQLLALHATQGHGWCNHLTMSQVEGPCLETFGDARSVAASPFRWSTNCISWFRHVNLLQLHGERPRWEGLQTSMVDHNGYPGYSRNQQMPQESIGCVLGKGFTARCGIKVAWIGETRCDVLAENT